MWPTRDGRQFVVEAGLLVYQIPKNERKDPCRQAARVVRMVELPLRPGDTLVLGCPMASAIAAAAVLLGNHGPAAQVPMSYMSPPNNLPVESRRLSREVSLCWAGRQAVS